MRKLRPAVRIAAALLTGLSLAAVSEAGTIVVPNQYATTQASTSGLNTFIRDAGNPRTGQLLIDDAELTGIPIGFFIVGMTYRLFTGANSPFPASPATWADYAIRVGTGGPLPGSTTFANNFVGAPTIVRSGPFTFPTGALPVDPANPNPFGMNIDFTTAFQYNGGNLCVEVRHPGSNITNNPANDFLEVALTSDPNYNVRFWSATATSATATVGTVANFTLVRLDISPVPVELLGFSIE